MSRTSKDFYDDMFIEVIRSQIAVRGSISVDHAHKIAREATKRRDEEFACEAHSITDFEKDSTSLSDLLGAPTEIGAPGDANA